MRILVVNPNTSDAMTASIAQAARAVAARGGTVVDYVGAPFGPRSIEGHAEEAIAAAATVEVIARERDEYDAFVVACFGDPGGGGRPRGG
ncbi:MAG: hypothetical protein IT336_05840 [Thermomicrobiales bacterium]|nr:hypothetical protein [Thermomicrobiales bacterium]